MTLDMVNACFEMGMALMVLRSVRALWRDKIVLGVSVFPTLLATLWGVVNVVWYYRSLHQWWSWAAGCAVLLANTAWLALWWRYRLKRKWAPNFPGANSPI